MVPVKRCVKVKGWFNNQGNTDISFESAFTKPGASSRG